MPDQNCKIDFKAMLMFYIENVQIGMPDDDLQKMKLIKKEILLLLCQRRQKRCKQNRFSADQSIIEE